MIPSDLVDAINEIRGTYMQVTDKLPEIPSFRSLMRTSATLPAAVNEVVRVMETKHLARPCDGRVTVAVIGSSGHGKTTVLDEMFPGLSERGWLVTDVTDTTSQSLRIEYAPDGSPLLDDIEVRSWNVEQIKELLHLPEVADQHRHDNIRVRFLEDAVEVDGTDARFQDADAAQFRFPRKVRLRPFSEPYRVPAERARDTAFIRSLTVKEQSAVLTAGPLLKQGGETYDALQLRAVVKDVCLRDRFENIRRWSGRPDDEVARLTFVDTPGLAVQGSAKDEVLRHCLENKSSQIALQLWKDDELDFVVHLVLCGRQSDFAELWKAIERECGPAELADLQDRLIVAVNGMNIYFTNRDIKQKYDDPETARREGDHFATTLQDNVLQKMSPRGRVRPARVCFLDSKSIVETLTTGTYEDAYAKYRPIMERWLEPGGVGHSTLRELDLVDAFRENVDALCDPDDRGQGHLVRQLQQVVEEEGPALLIRKHLCKTGLLGGLASLEDILTAYYDDEGRMNREATQQALGACLSFLDRHDLGCVERFAAEHLDARILEIVPRRDPPDDWVRESFLAMCDLVKENVLFHGEAASDVQRAFARHFDGQVRTWAADWGYTDAELAAPDRGLVNSADLVTHCLRLHARDILYLLLVEERVAGVEQGDEDRAQVEEVLRLLEHARRRAAALCSEYGVGGQR